MEADDIAKVRGLYASTALRGGEEAAFVPLDLILHPETVAEDVMDEVMEELDILRHVVPAETCSVYRSMLILVVGLLHERRHPTPTFQAYVISSTSTK